MNRRLIILIVLPLFFACKTETKEAEKPNIIYFLADDLGYGELGVYGQDKIETPNIDALAGAGVLFTQHYSGVPVCALARSVLLTGQHMGHTPIRGDVWNAEEAENDINLEGHVHYQNKQ